MLVFKPQTQFLSQQLEFVVAEEQPREEQPRVDPPPAFHELARVRYPFACRQEQGHSLKYNGPGCLMEYCMHCEAITVWHQCLRADPDRRLALLRRVGSHKERTCPRCGATFMHRAKYCDTCSEELQFERLRADRLRHKHPCAFEGCAKLVGKEATYCPQHGQMLRPDLRQTCAFEGCDRKVGRGATYCKSHSNKVRGKRWREKNARPRQEQALASETPEFSAEKCDPDTT